MEFLCDLLKEVVPDFMNLPFMYLILIAKGKSSSFHFILLTYVPAGPLPASLRDSMILLWYSMIRSSDWFFVVLLPEYVDQITVVIATSWT